MDGSRSALAGWQVQVHQLARGALEARRRAQQQAALEAGGGHRHVPALPFVTDAVLHRHLDVVEEDLGEGLLAVEGRSGGWSCPACPGAPG
jgi:hypothetical protein